jgi:hypothetical protein
MSRRGTGTGAVTLAVLLSMSGVGWGRTERSPASTQLPLVGHSDIVVDAEHLHVFVTGHEEDDSSIVVLDYNGTIVSVIPGMPGASAMVLDGTGNLYVALTQGHAIVVIDTASLTERERIVLPQSQCPRALTLTSGSLWMAFTCGHGFGSFDLITEELTLYRRAGAYSPILGSSPGRPDLLVLGERNLSPATIHTMRIWRDGRAHLVESAFGPAGSSDLSDMVVLPDGERLIAAFGYPYLLVVFHLPDVRSIGTYHTGAYPNSVAVALDGELVAGGISSSDDDIHLFHEGEPAAFRTYNLADIVPEAPELVANGLAFEPDGGWLFAVSRNVWNDFAFTAIKSPSGD